MWLYSIELSQDSSYSSMWVPMESWSLMKRSPVAPASSPAVVVAAPQVGFLNIRVATLPLYRQISTQIHTYIHCSHCFGEPRNYFRLAGTHLATLQINSLHTCHIPCFSELIRLSPTEKRSHNHVTFDVSVIPVVNSNHGISDAAVTSSVGGSHTSPSSCGSGCSASCPSTAMEGVRRSPAKV